MKSAYFESFTVDQVGVVIRSWWCELAASSGGVNCGLVSGVFQFPNSVKQSSAMLLILEDVYAAART